MTVDPSGKAKDVEFYGMVKEKEQSPDEILNTDHFQVGRKEGRRSSITDLSNSHPTMNTDMASPEGGESVGHGSGCGQRSKCGGTCGAKLRCRSHEL